MSLEEARYGVEHEMTVKRLRAQVAAQQAVIDQQREALDWLHVEALNGVICTPPPYEGDDFGDYGGYNVEAETSRNYCASCKAGWRKVEKARAAAASTGKAEDGMA